MRVFLIFDQVNVLKHYKNAFVQRKISLQIVYILGIVFIDFQFHVWFYKQNHD